MLRRIALFLSFAAFLSGNAKADTQTSRLGLTLISTGTANWGTKLNNQVIAIIDSSAAAQNQPNTFTAQQNFIQTVTFVASTTLSGPVSVSSNIAAEVNTSMPIYGRIANHGTGEPSVQIYSKFNGDPSRLKIGFYDGSDILVPNADIMANPQVTKTPVVFQHLANEGGMVFVDSRSVIMADQDTVGAGNIVTVKSGSITATGNVSAPFFVGNGSLLTGVSAGACATGGGSNSVLCMGLSNTAGGTTSVVSGGQGNSAAALSATVSGGDNNSALQQYDTVGGGFNNTANGQYATAAGGYQNSATAGFNFVGGGFNNTASGGGFNNILGGQNNQNLAANGSSAINGGDNNVISAANVSYGVIAGGNGNNIATNSAAATVGGGVGNIAGGTQGTVSGGVNNTATGNFSAVPGGNQNTATATYSFAAGFQSDATATAAFALGDDANADQSHCFVWADGNATGCRGVTNSFNVKSSNGAFFDVPTATFTAVISVGSGNIIVYRCTGSSGGTFDGNLAAGNANAGACSGGTWVAVSLKVD